MNYDTVLLELLSRVQSLEEQVATLNKKCGGTVTADGESNMTEDKKVTTTDIKNYIDELKVAARAEGKSYIVLVARDINNELQLKQRYPMVCNAMRQSMTSKDEIVFSPASGYSSTLEIKYYL